MAGATAMASASSSGVLCSLGVSSKSKSSRSANEAVAYRAEPNVPINTLSAQVMQRREFCLTSSSATWSGRTSSLKKNAWKRLSGRSRRGNSSSPRAAVVTSTAAVEEGSAQNAVWRNPIGLHAMVWVGGWSKHEARLAIDGSARLGYDLIEVPVSDPSSIDKELTRSLLKEFGLGATASLCLSRETDISSPDAEIAALGEKLLLDAVDTCVGIGATVLTGVTYSALAKYPSAHDKSGPSRANMVKALKNVSKRAADGGLKIGLEVVNRYESNVLNTAQQGVELVEEVDAPNIFVHLDTYHMNIEENSLAGAIDVCGDKLQYVHIGESHRGYLGSGQVKWEELFRALVRANYKGPLTFESFSSEVVNARLSNDLCVWRNLWEDSEDLARTAKEFIDAQWDAAIRSAIVR